MGTKASNYAGMATAGLKVVKTAKDISLEEGADLTEDERKKQATWAAGMAEVMWKNSLIKIASLLHAVCKKVTHDTSVEKEVRAKRCNALKIAGEVFVTCSKENGTAGAEAMEELLQKLGAPTASPRGEASASAGEAGYAGGDAATGSAPPSAPAA